MREFGDASTSRGVFVGRRTKSVVRRGLGMKTWAKMQASRQQGRRPLPEPGSISVTKVQNRGPWGAGCGRRCSSFRNDQDGRWTKRNSDTNGCADPVRVDVAICRRGRMRSER